MAKKFLTLNIGASAIALAEYEASGSRITLLNYGTATLAAPLDAGDVETILSPALLEIVREKGMKPGPVAIAVSGQMVFPRFAAIPFTGSDDAKFRQMVRYEIEQNIPFPIDEMVCDHQVLGDTASGDKSVMIVAAKVDQIEGITDALIASGFQPMFVDVASLAVVNTYKAAHGDEEGCVVILDIGAKTTSLAIVEGDKLYNRSIPVAGNTITKEIANTLGCSLEEAEQIKKDSAYVSLGGVMEDEDPTLDAISKVCRAVLTRLHAEISRSINFYRSQQGGGLPTKLYLTGGSALLPQMDAFFGDSLQIEVEFLNPFEVIAVSPAVNAEALATDSAFLAPTAGLALHEAKLAPLTINLIPPSLVAARAEVARIPFIAVGAASLVAASICFLLTMNHGLAVIQACMDAVEGKMSAVKRLETRVKAAQTAEEAKAKEAETLRTLLTRRGSAVARFNAVRLAIGEDLWIDRCENDKITLRGWKDQVDAFTARVAARDKEQTKPQTAPEIVTARLKANPVIDPESVRVTNMSTIDRAGSLEQYVMEMKFK